MTVHARVAGLPPFGFGNDGALVEGIAGASRKSQCQTNNQPMRSNPVEDVGGDGIAADEAGQDDNQRDGDRVQEHDEDPVHEGFEAPDSRTRRSLEEEGILRRSKERRE